VTVFVKMAPLAEPALHVVREGYQVFPSGMLSSICVARGKQIGDLAATLVGARIPCDDAGWYKENSSRAWRRRKHFRRAARRAPQAGLLMADLVPNGNYKAGFLHNILLPPMSISCLHT